MALNDNATLNVQTGRYLQAPVGTEFPADLTDLDPVWTDLGHSSVEDIMTIESDGGDTEVLGTLQNRNLRTRRGNRTETINIILNQLDESALKLYYGSNAVVDPVTSAVQVPSQPTPTQCAFLAIFVDSGRSFALHIPKAEIFRGDDVEIEDTEGLVGLPVAITPLQHATNQHIYSVSILGA